VGSIPTAPTNISLFYCELQICEGALGGSGLVLQRPETIHRPELSIVSRFEMQVKHEEKGALPDGRAVFAS
jgi:hypothetical protein